MKNQFRLFKRSSGIFYLYETSTRRQKTLRTRDQAEATKLVQAYNDAVNQAGFNRELARIYTAGVDPLFATRTWQDVMDHIVKRQDGDNRRRWTAAVKSKHFDCIRNLKLPRTRPEDLDRAMACRKPSIIEYLRRLHTHALDMEWLFRSIIPKPLWPKITPKRKRAITWAEHTAILVRETNPERRDFYDLLWHTGASQGDAAAMLAENIKLGAAHHFLHPAQAFLQGTNRRKTRSYPVWRGSGGVTQTASESRAPCFLTFPLSGRATELPSFPSAVPASKLRA